MQTYRKTQNFVVSPSGDVRQGFREVLNETSNFGQVTIVERYNRQEAVIIPYDWLMSAQSDDFTQLVNAVRMAVEQHKK